MKSRKNTTPAQSQDDRERNDALNKGERDSAEEKKLPGEYPANEDIMNRMNMHRVGMDVENFSRMIGTENLNLNEIATEQYVEDRRDLAGMEHPVPKGLDDEDIDEADRSESDVTEEDLQALGPRDLSMDMGEDEEILKNRVWPVDMAGTDLDVPGSEGAGDVEDEAIGPEDEENDFYSLGGDAHEDNLEGK
jgi:hypothetical protein